MPEALEDFLRSLLEQESVTVTNHAVNYSELTHALALGEGIWTPERMQTLVRRGFTHILSVQDDFDERPLAEPWGIEVCWNPVADDFQPKPPEFFQRAIAFAREALALVTHRLYVHCAAGVHRGPLAALAILADGGMDLDDALALIQARRPTVDFPAVYVDSLRAYLAGQPGPSPETAVPAAPEEA